MPSWHGACIIWGMSTPTEFTVRPATSLSRPEKPIFGVYTPGDSDHGTLDDVAKAANPLHYVPFVSHVYEAATGNTGSAAMKIIGGAIIGGPVGFIAGLASAIFEQEKGKTIVASIADAISGEESATQVASAEATQQIASMRGIATPTQEILPPESTVQASQKIAQAVAEDHAIHGQMQMASAVGALANPLSKQDQDVLSLFGAEQKSAHKSYQNAQMRNYLRDVTTSQVI